MAVVLSMTEECYEFNDKLSVELRQCKPELDTAREQASEQGRERGIGCCKRVNLVGMK